MHFPIRIIALTFALLASLAACAQTTTLSLAPHACGLYNPAQPYCYGVPVLGQYPAMVWIDYRTTLYAAPSPLAGTFGFVEFGALDGLGEALVLGILPDGTLSISGIDSNNVSYHGTLSYTFMTYRGCVSGRIARCGIYWAITGGKASVQRVDYSLPLTGSPIAPTPTCLDSPSTPCPPKQDNQ